MADEIERRVAILERNHDSIAGTLVQINRTLEKLEGHIDELFEVKSKIDSINTAWRKIDTLAEDFRKMDKDLHLMRSDHSMCKPIVDTIAHCKADFDNRLKNLEATVGATKSFIGGRLGGLIDQFAPVLISMIAAYMVAKGVGK